MDVPCPGRADRQGIGAFSAPAPGVVRMGMGKKTWRLGKNSACAIFIVRRLRGL
jgi:hypothetical protein